MGPVAQVIGAIASVVGTVASVRQARKSVKLQEQQQRLATRRSRRQAIRQAQIARAQTVAGAQATGALGSSSVAGGLGSLQSQLGEQIGFSTQMSGLSRAIGQAESRAQTFQAVAGIGSSVVQLGYNNGHTLSGSFKSLFQTPNKAQVGPPPTTSLRPRLRPF